MRRSHFILFFMICFAVLVSSCYYDSEQYIYGASECDTTDVTYSATIQPIIELNCYICHSSANASFAGGDNVLEGYENIIEQVEPGIAEESNLYGDIAWLPGFNHMPKGQPQISDCDIAKVKKWIDDGALNN